MSTSRATTRWSEKHNPHRVTTVRRCCCYVRRAWCVSRSMADESMCVFILSTPDSGSSTMVELLGQHLPDCDISGENAGAVQHLGRFHAAVHVTNSWRVGAPSRSNLADPQHAHMRAAWKHIFDFADVARREADLLRALLNPRHKPCWGFKEIRYGRGWQNIDEILHDVEFLFRACSRPKVVLHSRRDEEAYRGRPGADNSVQQHRCYDSLKDWRHSQYHMPACNGSRIVHHQKHIYRHHLEDYIEQNAVHVGLWGFLGLKVPSHNHTIIRLSSHSSI